VKYLRDAIYQPISLMKSDGSNFPKPIRVDICPLMMSTIKDQKSSLLWKFTLVPVIITVSERERESEVQLQCCELVGNHMHHLNAQIWTSH